MRLFLVLAFLSLVLPPGAAGADGSGGQTLWLVRPLYPGQEALVTRTEASIQTLVGTGAESADLVGRKQLMGALSGGKSALDCVFGPGGCPDPIGSLLTGSGIERVVMVRVGQETGSYRIHAASFQAGRQETPTAESAHARLEDALLAAVVRVVPLAAVVEVISDPPGATVSVDGEVLGVAPLSTQVMPGERKLRLELGGYGIHEAKERIPARGQLRIERTLLKMPGRIHVVSPGAAIFIDGQEAGRDEVEIGSTPGVHRIRLVRDGYEPYETTVELQADQVARVEHALVPGTWESILIAFAKAREEIFAQGTYIAFVYDNATLTGDRFAAQATGSLTTKLDGLNAPASSSARVHGFGVEYGSLWNYAGLLWVGGSYFQSFDEWRFGLTDDGLGLDPRTRRPLQPENDEFRGSVKGIQLRFLQPQLRFPIWRFTLGARGGFLGRGGWITDANETFVMGDFGVEARGSLQYHIYSGLFAELGYGHSWTLVGSTDGTSEWRGGIGYAF